MTIEIVTRSLVDSLYEQAMQCVQLPYPKLRFVDTTSDNYFIRIFLRNTDWSINIDEDCFVVDNAEIQYLLDYMIEEGYDYCGTPDGGVYATRHASPLVMNAFFNIFNITKIQGKLDINAIVQSDFSEDLIEKTPFHLLRDTYSYLPSLEPYYRVFYWLIRHFRPLWLDARTLADGITTELLSHRGRPLCWHTWYGRDYLTDPIQRERIDKVIAEARQ